MLLFNEVVDETDKYEYNLFVYQAKRRVCMLLICSCACTSYASFFKHFYPSNFKIVFQIINTTHTHTHKHTYIHTYYLFNHISTMCMSNQPKINILHKLMFDMNQK